MKLEPDIELVVIDTDHFLDTYRDVVDFEHPDTQDLDGSDMSGVVDFNSALGGLSQRPLSDWFYWRAGSQDFGVTNDAVSVGHDTDNLRYEYIPVLEASEPELPEPEMEAILTVEPEIEGVIIDSDHFIERYRDIFDLHYGSTPDIDGNDLSDVLDFALPMRGLAAQPLTRFYESFQGDGAGVVAWHGEFPAGFSLSERKYETPAYLGAVEARYPEPEIELCDLSPDIEVA